MIGDKIFKHIGDNADPETGDFMIPDAIDRFSKDYFHENRLTNIMKFKHPNWRQYRQEQVLTSDEGSIHVWVANGKYDKARNVVSGFSDLT